MKLSAEEFAWVDQKMATYEIKFQEVYDELKDHILTAIETLRTTGDEREIGVLFNEVVRKQFPGYWPFEEIVKQSKLAYGRKIWQALWLNYRHYFNWETVPVMVLLLAGSIYLPQSKPVLITLMIVLFIVSLTPVFYVWMQGRKIKTDKGKQSLVKMYLVNSSNMLIVMFNLLFNLVRMIADDWAPASFLNPKHYSPVVDMLLIILAFIYCMSCLRLAKQEFKIAG